MVKKLQNLVSIFLVAILVSISWADNIKTGPRPGEENPVKVNKRALFSDDELFVLLGSPEDMSIHYTALVPQGDDLTHWSAQTTTHAFSEDESEFAPLGGRSKPPTASARGRFTHHDIDQVVYTFVRPDQESITVEFWDAVNGRHAESANIPTVPPKSWQDGMLDVAAGDLDGQLDDKGFSHDEIVVARFGNSLISIDVLDSSLSVIARADLPVSTSFAGVSVALGDFNMDGQLEIGLAQSFRNGESIIKVEILDFDQSGPAPKLVSKSSLAIQNSYLYADLAVGDFNGDGRDELAVATQQYLRILTVDVSPDDKWQINEVTESLMHVGGCGQSWIPVRLATGLFKFAPDDGFHLQRRQLALCRTADNLGNISAKCGKIIVEDDFTTREVSPFTADLGFGTCQFSSNLIDLSVGNFVGHGIDGKATSPLQDMALNYSYTKESGTAMISRVAVSAKQDPWAEFIWQGSVSRGWEGFFPMAVLSIVSADIDGDSYILGPPAHMVVDDSISMDYVIQEPPKHVDYLPMDPTNPAGTWDVANVSGDSDFYVEFKDVQGITFETSATNTSSWSMGTAASEDIKASVSTLGDAEIWGVSLSVEEKAKLTETFNESESSWNSQYASRQVSFTSKTNRDDFIAAKMQLIDIWRFPIIGYVNPDPDKPAHGFMDIVLPGPKLTFKSGGKDHSDWYQPVHQNRNILSYPSLKQESFPPDLGSFTWPGSKVPVHDTMNEMDVYSYGGISQVLNISWSEKSGSGSEKEYNHALGESGDVKTGFKLSVPQEWGSVKVKGSIDISFNNENSWSGKSTESCINSESKGITLNVPASSSPNQGYAFKTAVYVDSGTGALKVAHATDPIGSTEGQLWWTNQYGRLPDPALNLPNRFVWHEPEGIHRIEYWTLNEDPNRKEMRGFFMRKGEANPVSGAHEILGGPPVDGDAVQLCARVYNFALYNETSEFDVLFETIQMDQAGFEVAGTREVVGSVRTSLDSVQGATDRHMKELCVNWDTSGLSASLNGYRFYVTVDPDNEIVELHEWKDLSGNIVVHGNNEGYWPWGGGIHVLKKDPLNGYDGPSPVSLKVAWATPSQGPLKATSGKEYLLQARVEASGNSPHFHNVIFSEGHPSDGNIISVRRVSLVEGETIVRTRWIPDGSGEKELYVHVMQSSEIPENEEDTAGLSVKVYPLTGPPNWGERVLYKLIPEL